MDDSDDAATEYDDDYIGMEGAGMICFEAPNLTWWNVAGEEGSTKRSFATASVDVLARELTYDDVHAAWHTLSIGDVVLESVEEARRTYLAPAGKTIVNVVAMVQPPGTFIIEIYMGEKSHRTRHVEEAPKPARLAF